MNHALGRMNIYYDNRVEKWQQSVTTVWEPFTENDDEIVDIDDNGRKYKAAAVWLTDDGKATGESLGIPVFSMKNYDDRSSFGISDIDQVTIIQEIINKVTLDLLQASDMVGSPLITTTATASTEALYYKAGQIIHLGPGTSWQMHLPGDLSQLMNLKEASVLEMARLSGLPISRFTTTKAVASEGTLKQQEAGFLAKLENKQVIFGNAWEDAVRYSLLVDKIYNDGTLVELNTDEINDLEIDSQWQDLSPRSDMENADIAKIKKEIGVPDQAVFEAAGYTDAQSKEFVVINEAKVGTVIGNFVNELNAESEDASNGANEPAISTQEAG